LDAYHEGNHFVVAFVLLVAESGHDEDDEGQHDGASHANQHPGDDPLTFSLLLAVASLYDALVPHLHLVAVQIVLSKRNIGIIADKN